MLQRINGNLNINVIYIIKTFSFREIGLLFENKKLICVYGIKNKSTILKTF